MWNFGGPYIHGTNINYVYIALSFFFFLIHLKSDTDIYLWFKAKHEILACHCSKGDKENVDYNTL